MDGMLGELALVQMPGALIPVQADSDAELLRLWLHGRSASTREAYAGDARAFAAHTGKPLRTVNLRDVQAFADNLVALKSASQAR